MAGGLGFALNCLVFSAFVGKDESTGNREVALPAFCGGGVSGGRGRALLFRLVFFDLDDCSGNRERLLSLLLGGGVAGGLGFALNCLVLFNFSGKDEIAGM